MQAGRKWAISIVFVLVALVLVSARVVSVSPWTKIAQPPPFPAPDSNFRPVLQSSQLLPQAADMVSPKPVVAADLRGRICVVAYGMTRQSRPSDCELRFWRSQDHGTDWNWPESVGGDVFNAGQLQFDPWMKTDRRGRFYLVYSCFPQGGLWFRRSRDGGKSWSQPVAICRESADRPVLGISPDGQLLVVAAAISERTAEFPQTPLNRDDPHFAEKVARAFLDRGGLFLSRDFGASWVRLKSPFERQHAIPFSVVVNNTGGIAAGWIVEGNGSSSCVTSSLDQGQFWLKAVLVESLQPDRPHPFNGERFPVLAIDGRERLHAAFVTRRSTAIHHQYSVDWKNWSEAVLLSSDRADEVRMPAIDACGALVHVTWLERFGDRWKSVYRGSRDLGDVWSEPVPLLKNLLLPDGATTDDFLLSSDDDQSSVCDDGTGLVHALWAIRQGGGVPVVHATVKWAADSADERSGNRSK